MSLNRDALLVARDEMTRVNRSLVGPFEHVVNLLVSNPELAPALRGRGAPEVGTTAYVRRLVLAFAEGRDPRAPQPPTTVPDVMVSVILRSYFDMSAPDAERTQREHQLAMGAENLVGDLLERYLASVLEPRGWVWCSGSVVKSVDFVRPPTRPGDVWRLVQVKNRDNSENSSSSRVRDGNDIEKWFRTFSRTGDTNWPAFPEPSARSCLNEAAFQQFVATYLRDLR
jgi:hypothetical protein